MPTAGGPNTLGESNLVFAYDTGDVENSYKGEPTVNVFPDPKILNGTSGWGISNATGGTTTVDTGRNGGQSIKVTVASGGDQYQYRSYGYGVNKGGSTFTYSAYIKTSGIVGTGVGMSTYWFDINGSFIFTNLTASTRVTGNENWTRVTATSTAPAGTYYVVAIFYPVDKNGLGTYWITDVQIEEKSHVTPFTIGTRSATQGLLPVIGNSTLDLTNMSFDSSAKMTFDGTDDYISCGTLSFNFSQGITVEAVANFTNVGAWQRIIDFGNGSASNNILLARYGSTDNLYFEIYNGSSSTSINTSGGILNSQLCHYVVTVNGAIAYVYRNGVLLNSGTFATVPTTVSRTNCYIGKSNWADYYYQGIIPITKLYNRALTALEVKQNYQQYKTRFNLS